MQNLKFFTLLRSLNEEECAAFHKQLKRCYAREKIALAVFEYILKFAPDFWDDKKLDIAYAHRKIFGSDLAEKDSNRTKMLNALSDLSGWLKTFLLTEKMRADTFVERFLWLAILKERGLEDEYAKQAARLQTELRQTPPHDLSGYLKRLALSHFIHSYPEQSRQTSESATLEQYFDDLEAYAATLTVKAACEQANRRKVRSIDPEPQTRPMLTALAEHDFPLHQPIPALYQAMHRLLSASGDQSYEAVVEAVSKQAAQIGADELAILIAYLHNYASGQIRNGNEAFWESSHRLNQLGVEHHLFLRKGLMSAKQFLNIVNVAIKVKDFGWAAHFIEEQSKFLTREEQNDAKLLAQATVLFDRGAFAESLQTLEQSHSKDLHLMIRAKALAVRCRYEQKDEDLLDFCLNFEVFLRRNRKHRAEYLEATLNFLHILKLLMRKKISREKLLASLAKKTPIYFKPWLLEKMTSYKADFAAHKR